MNNRMVREVECPHCAAVLDVKVKVQLVTPGEILEESVTKLSVSMRLYNVLLHAHILTVGELAEKTESELGRIKGCGKKTVPEVRSVLAAKGLQLRPEGDEAQSAELRP
jgi:DNA-directed RNA polymerase alpha subunit